MAGGDISNLFAAATSKRADPVRLVDADRPLFEAVPASALERHAPATTTDCVRAAAGAWEPPHRKRAFALLVVSGFLLGRFTTASWTRSELVGPGDLIGPSHQDIDDERTHQRWHVVTPARLALIDEHLLERLPQRWPSIVPQLASRALRRAERLMRQHAILGVRRLEDRLTLLLGEFGQTWGKVTGDEILVPVPLTHQMLAELAGARRPTVTSALAQLAQDGAVKRANCREWQVSYPAIASALSVASGMPLTQHLATDT